MKHEMTVATRDMFELMHRQSFRSRTGTRAPWRTYFEADVCSRPVAVRLEKLGWLTRCATGRRSRPSTITLTDVGMWILGGVS
jgi:hypothetical protein